MIQIDRVLSYQEIENVFKDSGSDFIVLEDQPKQVLTDKQFDKYLQRLNLSIDNFDEYYVIYNPYVCTIKGSDKLALIESASGDNWIDVVSIDECGVIHIVDIINDVDADTTYEQLEEKLKK